MRGLLFFLPRTAHYGPHLEKPDRLGQIVAVPRIVVDGFTIRVYTDDHAPLAFMSSVMARKLESTFAATVVTTGLLVG